MLVVALLLGLGLPRCGDSFHLRWEAANAGLPPQRVEAIARVETACNLSPRLRAHRRGLDREAGRFQIKPSTARRACPGADIFTYRGNVACFLQTFSRNAAREGLTDATVRHNGEGCAALVYLRKVLKIEEAL